MRWRGARTIDRPLTERGIRELRRYSTRASITSTRFVNHYEWGDFKGDPSAWMAKYFDAFLYVANWGTRELMLRFPRRVLAAHCEGLLRRRGFRQEQGRFRDSRLPLVPAESTRAARRGFGAKTLSENLATREPAAWRQVEDLIATRRPAEYDQAVKLLADLRELGLLKNRVAPVDAQIQRLREQHAKKESLLTRLRRAGLCRR